MKEKIVAAVNFLSENKQRVSDQLRKEVISIEHPSYKAALVGQFKVGKSTLINKVFLKENILFADILEATAVPTEILYGSVKRLEVYPYVKRKDTLSITNDGKTETNEVETIDGTIGEAIVTNNPTTDDIKNATTSETPEGRAELARSVAAVKLYWPCESFKAHSFFDTPGINSGNPAVVQTTYNVIPKADVVIYMLSARGLSDVDANYLQSRIFEQGVSRVLMLVSYDPNYQPMDTKQLDKIVFQIKARLSAIGRDYIPVYPISLNFDSDIDKSIPHSASDIEKVITNFVSINVNKGKLDRIASRLNSELRSAIITAETERQSIDMTEKQRAEALKVAMSDKKNLKAKYEVLASVFLSGFRASQVSFREKIYSGLIGIRNNYKIKIAEAADTDAIRNILIEADAELRPQIDDLFFKEGDLFKSEIISLSEKFSSDFSDDIRKMELHTIIKIEGGVFTKIPAIVLKIADYILVAGPLPGGFLVEILLRYLLGKVPYIKDFMPYGLVKQFVVGHVQANIDEQFAEMRSALSIRLTESYNEAVNRVNNGFEMYMIEELQPIIDVLSAPSDDQPKERKETLEKFIPKAKDILSDIELALA